jgi:hypothetical protein
MGPFLHGYDYLLNIYLPLYRQPRTTTALLGAVLILTDGQMPAKEAKEAKEVRAAHHLSSSAALCPRSGTAKEAAREVRGKSSCHVWVGPAFRGVPTASL